MVTIGAHAPFAISPFSPLGIQQPSPKVVPPEAGGVPALDELLKVLPLFHHQAVGMFTTKI